MQGEELGRNINGKYIKLYYHAIWDGVQTED